MNRPVGSFSKRLFYVSFVSMLMISAILTSGCGRKDAPLPPEARAPRAVEFFEARGSVDGVLLSWSAPSKNAKGEQLFNLSEFDVLRRLVGKKFSSSRLREIANVELNEAQDKLQLNGKKIEDRFVFLDSDVEPGEQYEYLVTAVNDNGVSGAYSSLLRVSFVGENSVVESGLE